MSRDHSTRYDRHGMRHVALQHKDPVHRVSVMAPAQDWTLPQQDTEPLTAVASSPHRTAAALPASASTPQPQEQAAPAAPAGQPAVRVDVPPPPPLSPPPLSPAPAAAAATAPTAPPRIPESQEPRRAGDPRVSADAAQHPCQAADPRVSAAAAMASADPRRVAADPQAQPTDPREAAEPWAAAAAEPSTSAPADPRAAADQCAAAQAPANPCAAAAGVMPPSTQDTLAEIVAALQQGNTPQASTEATEQQQVSLWSPGSWDC